MALQKHTLQRVTRIQKLLKESGRRVTIRWIYYKLVVAQRIVSLCEGSYRRVRRICNIARSEGLIDKETLI